MAWGGTAWVVDKKPDGHVMLTNRHVAKLVAKRNADGHGVFIRSPINGVKYGAQVDFNEEVGAKAQERARREAVEIVYLADDVGADMALLKVKKVDDGNWSMPDPIPLAEKEAADKELVASSVIPPTIPGTTPTRWIAISAISMTSSVLRRGGS